MFFLFTEGTGNRPNRWAGKCRHLLVHPARFRNQDHEGAFPEFFEVPAQPRINGVVVLAMLSRTLSRECRRPVDLVGALDTRAILGGIERDFVRTDPTLSYASRLHEWFARDAGHIGMAAKDPSLPKAVRASLLQLEVQLHLLLMGL